MQINLKDINMNFGGRAYARAKPFPHIVIDNFLPAEVADQLERDFPDPEHDFWFRHTDIQKGTQNTEKLACNELARMPDSIRNFLEFMNTAAFLEKLSECTDIPELKADGEYHGGGMHLIKPGGFLNVHADFNYHTTLQMHRRLNLLLYLNKDWDAAYNGQLELWDRKMKKRRRSVDPVFNRCVIFSTTSDSFHGHPGKLSCPPGRVRKSLALYYYSMTRPQSEIREHHTTLYSPLPPGPGVIVRMAPHAKRAIMLPRRVAGKIKRTLFK